MKTTVKTAFVALALAAVSSLNLQAGTLEPTNNPSPSMYTLEEIYLKIMSLEQKMNDLAECLDCGGNTNVPPNMSLIPAGDFLMGDSMSDTNAHAGQEFPTHTVYVSAYYIDQNEVSKGFWDEVKAYGELNGYSYSNPGQGKSIKDPVHNVNWYDAVKWCNARSEREGLTPVYYSDALLLSVYKTGENEPFAKWSANGYRLPTEAEWEKAARGGLVGRRFPWGDSISHSHANYAANPEFDYDDSPYGYHPTFAIEPFPYTAPVGYFEPNGYALFDMAGNVWEWCWDWSGFDYYSSSPAADPRGPASGTIRVVRGGSWWDKANGLRVSQRGSGRPDTDGNDLGFRCVRGL